jgi:hypothetical protein
LAGLQVLVGGEAGAKMELRKAARRLPGAFREVMTGRVPALGGWKVISRMMEE